MIPELVRREVFREVFISGNGTNSNQNKFGLQKSLPLKTVTPNLRSPGWGILNPWETTAKTWLGQLRKNVAKHLSEKSEPSPLDPRPKLSFFPLKVLSNLEAFFKSNLLHHHKTKHFQASLDSFDFKQSIFAGKLRFQLGIINTFLKPPRPRLGGSDYSDGWDGMGWMDDFLSPNLFSCRLRRRKRRLRRNDIAWHVIWCTPVRAI